MAKQKYDWEQIKKEYLMGNLGLSNEKNVSLKDLAEKYKIPPNVVWNRACKEGWTDELEEARKMKNKELSQQIQKAALEVDHGQLLDEYRVRSEQFKVPTRILGKLLDHWENLTDDQLNKLTPSETIKGIQTCLKARAEAAGLPATIPANFYQMNPSANSGEPSVEDAIEDNKRIEKHKKILIKFLDFVEERNQQRKLSNNPEVIDSDEADETMTG